MEDGPLNWPRLSVPKILCGKHPPKAAVPLGPAIDNGRYRDNRDAMAVISRDFYAGISHSAMPVLRAGLIGA
jgi:hypothetical protein